MDLDDAELCAHEILDMLREEGWQSYDILCLLDVVSRWMQLRLYRANRRIVSLNPRVNYKEWDMADEVVKVIWDFWKRRGGCRLSNGILILDMAKRMVEERTWQKKNRWKR